jgi:hypothetical protein
MSVSTDVGSCVAPMYTGHFTQLTCIFHMACVMCIPICRLRRLEDSHEALGSDLDQIRELGRQLEAWKQQIEAASAQVATVLDLTQKDGTEIR